MNIKNEKPLGVWQRTDRPETEISLASWVGLLANELCGQAKPWRSAGGPGQVHAGRNTRGAEGRRSQAQCKAGGAGQTGEASSTGEEPWEALGLGRAVRSALVAMAAKPGRSRGRARAGELEAPAPTASGWRELHPWRKLGPSVRTKRKKMGIKEVRE